MNSNDPLPLTELPTKDIATDGLATKKMSADNLSPVGKEIRPELILGVEYDILIKFLKLFRDHYRKCEKATTFLEHRTDIPNIASIANQRDAVSHFKSALQPNVSREVREQQYATAEEHFRRAIIEPYETALRKKIDLLIPVLRQYRELVLPVKERYDTLSEFPDGEQLDDTFREIAKLRDRARTAKGKNIWDEVWEQGVEDYVLGFDLAHELLNQLEEAVYRFQQIQKDEETAGQIALLKSELKLRDLEIAKLKEREGS